MQKYNITQGLHYQVPNTECPRYVPNDEYKHRRVRNYTLNNVCSRPERKPGYFSRSKVRTGYGTHVMT
jgi:hypothetical protein